MIYISLYSLLFLLSILFVFHCCILLQLIDYKYIWGGRLKNLKEMYRFETTSIFITGLLIVFLLTLTNTLQLPLPYNIKKVTLWFMFLLFSFNTLGNTTSKNRLEKRLFTPLSLFMAICSLILALKI